MSLKKRIATIVLVSLLAVSLFGCLMAVVYQITPFYVESRIIPAITAVLGKTPVQFKIRRIQVNGTDLGPIVVGDPLKPAFVAKSVHIDYSPVKIYRKKIERIVVSGVELRVEYRNGKFFLPGIDLEAVLAELGGEKKKGAEAGGVAGSVFLGGLEVTNATALLSWNGRVFRLPVEAVISPENMTLSALNFVFSCFPRGGELNAKGRFDLSDGTAMVDYRLLDVEPARYADALPVLADLFFSGSAEVSGKANFNVSPFKLTSFSAHAGFRRVQLKNGNIDAVGLKAGKGSNPPIRVAIETGDGEEWAFSCSGLQFVSPMPARLDQIKGRMKLGSGSVEISGDFSFSMDPFTIKHSMPLSLSSKVTTKGRFSGAWAAPGHWEFMAGNSPGAKPVKSKKSGLKIALSGIDINTASPNWSVSGSGNPQKGEISFRLGIPAPRATIEDAAFRTDRLTVKGSIRLDNLSDNMTFTTKVELSAPRLKWKVNTLRGTVPNLNISGKATGNHKGIEGVDALMKFTGAQLSDPDLTLQAEGIRVRIPVSWPPEKSSGKGMVSVSGIKWQERSLGSVAAVVKQKGLGFMVTGTHVSNLLEDLTAHFSGQVYPESENSGETFVDLKIPDYQTAGKIDMGTFAPAAMGLRIGGVLGVSGRLAKIPGGLKVSLTTTVKEGGVFHEEKGFSVTGIDTALKISDLLEKRSDSRQIMRFDSAQMGELKMGAGKVEFQLESPGVLLIEKSSFEWCGGLVDAHALRISPEQDDYQLVLYCDRLILHRILEQFGAVQAEGTGTLNGKIPIRFKEGRLRFDDGFLYSSPGQGGTIRLTGTEILTAGIPKNTVQYNQLELAREALKDYTYKWVKLRLTTEGETLLLRMQMDGKPANPLPFVYDKDIGGFIKVEAGSKGSVFQGISLDVNFRLPLDRILTYKDILNNIEQ